MTRRSAYLIWIGVGTVLGGATVAVLALVYGISGLIFDGRVTWDAAAPFDPSLAFAATFIGGVYGAVGGFVAGALGAVVVHAMSIERGESATIDGAVAASVVAFVATPFWLLMFPDTVGGTVLVFPMPLLIAVAVAYGGGHLIWRLRSRPTATVAVPQS
jgi:hypothetical protein